MLCTYLYDVAGLFSSFYENCPILALKPRRKCKAACASPR